MKLYITIQQWNEISLSDKAKFKHYPVSIGDLIEFLGNDLSIDDNRYGIIWYKNEEICNELWTKCKRKLEILIRK